VAPSPSAAPLIDGGLGQSVVGLGAYSLINDMLYAEVTGYVSAPQETELPLGEHATNTPRAMSPYWRVGLQHQFTSDYLMIGTFGLRSKLYPSGIAGLTNNFTDLGADAQVEHKIGNSMLIGRATYLRERQSLAAAFTAQESQNVKNSLNAYKLNVSYIPNPSHTLTLGLFGSSGTRDDVLYGPGEVSGSATASPASQGEIVEFATSPWLNVRLGAQYVLYQKFNGATHNYDVPSGGRSAKDNNTLYLYLWFAY
jgi:hypothetical protein